VNLLFISLYYPPYYSGAGNSLERLIKYLSPYVKSCRLITLSEASSSVAYKQVTQCRVEPVYCRGSVTATCVQKQQLIKFAIFASLKCLFGKHNDIVYFNGYLKIFILIMIFARLRGSRVIVKITGDNEDSINFHKKTFAGRIFVKLSGWCVSDFITINQKMYDDCVAIFKVKTHKLGNIVDFRKPRDEKNLHMQFNTKINFLFMGVLSHRKGFDRLQELWLRLVDDRNINQNLKLNVVGPTDPYTEVRPEFEKLVSVNLVGEIKPDKVKEYLANTDILLFPSRSEGLPNAVIEALIYGVCVIGYDVPGVQDLLRCGRGYLVNSDDQFYQISKKLIHSSELRCKNNDLVGAWCDNYDSAIKDGYKRLFIQGRI
jgi:glycosyltransferase involved in cell wall biosynthesis